MCKLISTPVTLMFFLIKGIDSLPSPQGISRSLSPAESSHVSIIKLISEVLIVTLIYAFRKQKPRSVEKGIESEELLNTKKLLCEFFDLIIFLFGSVEKIYF